jgi:ABC-type phosphate transport system substrate-binding protein
MNRMLVLAAALAAAVSSADENGSGDIDSDEELGVAFAAGTAVIAGSGSSFVCPVIKVPLSGA